VIGVHVAVLPTQATSTPLALEYATFPALVWLQAIAVHVLHLHTSRVDVDVTNATSPAIELVHDGSAAGVCAMMASE
jgi:hypothetical protein